jgi:hypothetical protein
VEVEVLHGDGVVAMVVVDKMGVLMAVVVAMAMRVVVVDKVAVVVVDVDVAV